MDNCMVGDYKHGCYINNETQELIYFDLLSLAEKLQGKTQKTVINYQTIESVNVCYSLNQGVRFGSTTITLEVHLTNGVIKDIVILYLNTKREELNCFIRALLASGLNIIDEKHLLQTILDSDERVGTIIANMIQK